MKVMKKSIVIAIFLIPLLVLVGCSTPVASEGPKEKEVKNQNFEWIKLDVPYVFVSNQKDTFSFKIVDELENTEMSGKADYFTYTKYKYIHSWSKKKQDFIEFHSSSDGWSDLSLSFLEGKFDVLTQASFDSKDSSFIQKASNLKLNQEVLKDVWYVKSKNPVTDSAASIVWWSRSKGLVRFSTGDKKVWSRLQ